MQPDEAKCRLVVILHVGFTNLMQLAFIMGLSYTWLNNMPNIYILIMSGEVDWNHLVVDLRLGLLLLLSLVTLSENRFEKQTISRYRV